VISPSSPSAASAPFLTELVVLLLSFFHLKFIFSNKICGKRLIEHCRGFKSSPARMIPQRITSGSAL